MAQTNRACDETKARFKFSPPQTCGYPSNTWPTIPCHGPLTNFCILTWFMFLFLMYFLSFYSIIVVYGMQSEFQASTAQLGKAVKLLASLWETELFRHNDSKHSFICGQPGCFVEMEEGSFWSDKAEGGWWPMSEIGDKSCGASSHAELPSLAQTTGFWGSLSSPWEVPGHWGVAWDHSSLLVNHNGP